MPTYKDYDPKNKYEIQGQKVRQSPLSIRQELDLIHLFNDREFDIDMEKFVEMLDDKGITGMICWLDDQDLLMPFFEIILEYEDEIDVEQISADNSWDIVMDFFFNNGKLIKKLKTLILESSATLRTMMESAGMSPEGRS